MFDVLAKMEEDEAEKRGILCLKSIKVYGTTGDLSCSSNQFPRLYNRDYEHVEFIDHIVTERDTLQGLSLKYDCTVSIFTSFCTVYLFYSQRRS